MADVIKTIGASGSGADYANYQTWFAARTGGAGDRLFVLKAPTTIYLLRDI